MGPRTDKNTTKGERKMGKKTDMAKAHAILENGFALPPEVEKFFENAKRRAVETMLKARERRRQRHDRREGRDRERQDDRRGRIQHPVLPLQVPRPRGRGMRRKST